MKTLVCAFLYNRKELLREERGKPMFWDKVAGVYDLFENLYNKKSIPGDRHSGGKADKYKR